MRPCSFRKQKRTCNEKKLLFKFVLVSDEYFILKSTAFGLYAAANSVPKNDVGQLQYCKQLEKLEKIYLSIYSGKCVKITFFINNYYITPMRRHNHFNTLYFLPPVNKA